MGWDFLIGICCGWSTVIQNVISNDRNTCDSHVIVYLTNRINIRLVITVVIFIVVVVGVVVIFTVPVESTSNSLSTSFLTSSWPWTAKDITSLQKLWKPSIRIYRLNPTCWIYSSMFFCWRWFLRSWAHPHKRWVTCQQSNFILVGNVISEIRIYIYKYIYIYMMSIINWC